MKSRQLTPFGREIKKALVDLGMTQRKLADKVGVSPVYLNRIIFGERPGDKYMDKIITALSLSPEAVGQRIA